MITRLYIKQHERGLLFTNGDFTSMLAPGWFTRLWPWPKRQVTVVNTQDLTLKHDLLPVIAKRLGEHPDLRFVRIRDGERALIWRDGTFAGFRGPGLYAFWVVDRELKVEVVQVADPRCEHAALTQLLNHAEQAQYLQLQEVPSGTVGLLIVNGKLMAELPPSRYAFWRGAGQVEVRSMDLREQLTDISGQEVLSADKVTLRLNAVVTWQVADARKVFATVADPVKALYRDAQLALRALIGGQDLDSLLSAGCAAVVNQLTDELRLRAEGYGVRVISLGLRDLILPGEMRVLLNKVTEARKAAEADFITRREETAAMRAQLNSARLIADNPVLMRLRELEVLEKVADKAKLTVVLGERGLADRVTNLL